MIVRLLFKANLYFVRPHWKNGKMLESMAPNPPPEVVTIFTDAAWEFYEEVLAVKQTLRTLPFSIRDQFKRALDILATHSGDQTYFTSLRDLSDAVEKCSGEVIQICTQLRTAKVAVDQATVQLIGMDRQISILQATVDGGHQSADQLATIRSEGATAAATKLKEMQTKTLTTRRSYFFGFYRTSSERPYTPEEIEKEAARGVKVAEAQLNLEALQQKGISAVSARLGAVREEQRKLKDAQANAYGQIPELERKLEKKEQELNQTQDRFDKFRASAFALEQKYMLHGTTLGNLLNLLCKTPAILFNYSHGHSAVAMLHDKFCNSMVVALRTMKQHPRLANVAYPTLRSICVAHLDKMTEIQPALEGLWSGRPPANLLECAGECRSLLECGPARQ